MSFETVYCDPAIVKRGRPPINGERMTKREYNKRAKQIAYEEKLDNVAILDFETDPFDADIELKVFPFCCVLYADNFEPIIIWDENNERFIERVITAIERLPGNYLIYAHNGGKFDYMFLVHKLRGQVMFKGRGIMSAKIGRHELRDSFHIIPERLANWQKDDFDYSKMRKGQRHKFKKQIIEYCVNDCRYLLDIVKKFIAWNGFKLSIGQAAMMHLRKEYKVPRVGEAMDGFLRNWFFGGRVECLQGRGHWRGHYKLYDVNSMYPYVMATYNHPQGNLYTVSQGGRIAPNCCFLTLHCDNHGALIGKTEEGETTAEIPRGIFQTTIHEYRVAKRYNLITNVKILNTINCDRMGNFSRVIEPLYLKRMDTKKLLKGSEAGSYAYNEAKKDDMIMKFLLNNMYGKFAQNPRKYKEHFITAPDELPPDDTWGVAPAYECGVYWIWERPNPGVRFNNVGTAASITGAARSVLLEAIQLSDDPIYCDTDSLICRDLKGVLIDGTELGAWDIEQEISEIIITGKKQYAYRDYRQHDKMKLRSKGVSDMAWNDYVRMLDNQIIEKIAKAPTLTKLGTQKYMRRNIRATAPVRQKMRQPLLRQRI